MKKHNILTSMMLMVVLLVGSIGIVSNFGINEETSNSGETAMEKFTLASNGDLPGRFIGGTGGEMSSDVAVDSEGNVVVTGQTGSEDFPVATGTYGGGYRDAFIAKIDPDGDLLWSHYLGGWGTDLGLGIAVDSMDNIIIVGRTESTNFPTASAYDATLGGLADAFVSKFTSAGVMTWSTFLGGSDLDFGHEIFVDSNDDIVIVGETWSTDFPTTGNAAFPTYGENIDAFVSKLSADGTQLLLSSYLGGNDTDTARSTARYLEDHIIVTGYTSSMNFPTQDAYDSTINGGADVFVSLFNTSSGYLMWSTYIGGSDYDRATDAIVDSEGYVIVTGDTRSDDFPTLNAYDDDYGGGGTLAGDAFVLMIRGSELAWSTYLGGSGNEEDNGHSVCLDSEENIIVAGYTRSADFPTIDACFPDYHGNADAFVANFSIDGDLQRSTFLGGNSSDYAYGVAVDTQERIVVTGSTYSLNFPISLNSHSGESDGFVVFLVCSDGDTPTPTPEPTPLPCLTVIVPVGIGILVAGVIVGFIIGRRK